MKRWLAALAVFAACVCHVDIAAADTRPPTLWQRIVSVFAPRPAIRHPAGQHLADSPQKAAATAKPTEASLAAGTPPQPSGQAEQVVRLAAGPDAAPSSTPVETSSAAGPSPATAQLEVAPAVVPVKPARKREQRDKAKAQSRAETTAALPPSAPASEAQPVAPPVEPSELPSALAPGAETAPSKPTKKAKHNHATPGFELASLGSPGLKAALAPENVQPETAPHPLEGSAFPAAPTRGSVCNAGRKVITAYYWEGSHTASGQPFNPHAMTAAHRTLPFGTHLNVINPRTGKSVEVIVNDRGPYVAGVGLDLSIGAAQAIGLHGTGSVCIL
jgi:rare lipoprotein A